jgi:hypothetical protein
MTEQTETIALSAALVLGIIVAAFLLVWIFS